MMIKKRIYHIPFFFILILIQSCGSGKQLAEPASQRPDWVRSRPIVPGYYIGIGWAQKTSNVHQYQQAAKQNAFSDLASEISVSISSNSVLHAFESKLGFNEDFSSTIQARTQEELAGFDIVDTWEDQGNYWIYYRLSAIRHQEIKDKKRDDAVKLSSGLFQNALESRARGQFRTSLVQLISSMEAIKNHFDDPLPVQSGDRQIQLGNEIFNELSSTISQIEIIPVNPQIDIRTGQAVPSAMLRFKVSSRESGPVPDFPLVATYSERPIRNNRGRTDRDGNAEFGIDGVRSARSFETFTITADMTAILTEATTDPMIRRLISRFSIPEGSVRINIIKPVIMLVANEHNIGEELLAGTLRESFRKNAMEAGYLITDTPSGADFIVRITANTLPAGESGVYRNALLSGNISAEDNLGNQIFHRELDGFRGSHFEMTRAGEDAFRQAVRRMDSTFFRELDEALKKSSIK
jgi:hypothetical protein